LSKIKRCDGLSRRHTSVHSHCRADHRESFVGGEISGHGRNFLREDEAAVGLSRLHALHGFLTILLIGCDFL
jgi:hypothetical protein